MPKGHKLISWSPENDTKLLLAIIAVHNVKVDNNAVVKAFGTSLLNPIDIAMTNISPGDDIPGGAIANRMKVIRKKAAALGLTPSLEAPAHAKPFSVGPVGEKASTGTARGAKATTQKRKAGGMLHNDFESAALSLL